MKKTYIFTKDSSFIHIKDKMHREVTEHIIKDTQTERLYHYVDSYGSGFHVSYSSIFMSHLLGKIGVGGICKAYSADDCQIALPWNHYHKSKQQSIVELPQRITSDCVSFDYSHKKRSETFTTSFVGKTYKIKYKDKTVTTMKGDELLKELFGCVTHRLCELRKENIYYPVYCVLDHMSFYDQAVLKEMLEDTNILKQEEPRKVLQKFVEVDLKKEIQVMEEEVQVELDQLKTELIERQEIIKSYLIKQKKLDEGRCD